MGNFIEQRDGPATSIRFKKGGVIAILPPNGGIIDTESLLRAHERIESHQEEEKRESEAPSGPTLGDLNLPEGVTKKRLEALAAGLILDEVVNNPQEALAYLHTQTDDQLLEMLGPCGASGVPLFKQTYSDYLEQSQSQNKTIDTNPPR